MGSFRNFLKEKAENKGAFHRWLGKSEDEPITAADIAKGKAAGGHPAKMAIQAQNFHPHEFKEEIVEEGLRLTATHTNGDRTAKVYRDAEWEEHRVKHFVGGVHQHKADYHTQDKEEAHSHAKQWAEKTGVHAEETINELSKSTHHSYRKQAVEDEGRHRTSELIHKKYLGSNSSSAKEHRRVADNRNRGIMRSQLSTAGHPGYSTTKESIDEAKDKVQVGSEIGTRDVSRDQAASRLRRLRKVGTPTRHKNANGSRSYEMRGGDDAKGRERLSHYVHVYKEEVETLDEMMPIKDHPYHRKSDAELHYIMKDAHKAAQAVQGHDTKAHMKYLDQVNDAGTVMAYRRKGGKRVVEEMTESKIEKITAKEILDKHEARGKDFHTLSSSQVSGLVDSAKEHGYRKSKHAPGSTGRMFHQHLHRLIGEEVISEKKTNAKELIAKAEKEASKKAAQADTKAGGMTYIEALKAALRRIKGRKNIRQTELGVKEETEVKTVEELRLVEEKLEQHHHDALKRYAASNGRTWKNKLNTDWEKGHTHGDDTASIRQVRNLIGPSGLMKYKLKEEVVTEGEHEVVKHDNFGTWKKHAAAVGAEVALHGTPGVKKAVKHGHVYGVWHGNKGWMNHIGIKEDILDGTEQPQFEIEKQIMETLSKDADASDYVKDFVHSKNKEFSGDSKKQRIKRALGAYYSKNESMIYENLSSWKREMIEKHGRDDITFVKEDGKVKAHHKALDRVVGTFNEELMIEEMSHAAHELVLHADNDAHLHRSSHQPIIANLKKKAKKGTYDSEKAKKLWKYHADRAAQSYHKAHGDSSQHWSKAFPTKDRHEAAAHWEQHHRHEVHE